MAPSEETKFQVLDDSLQKSEPLTMEELETWAAAGRLHPTTWIWNCGTRTWKLAGEFPKLAPHIQAGPTPQDGGKFCPPIFGPLPSPSARHRWQAGPTSPLAITAFLCGIASLWIGPIAWLAIGLGHFAQWRFRHTPPVVGGFTLALYGLWLGYLSVSLLLFRLWLDRPVP
ncbi:MAG: DUF4190 domain-containing protein [Verrucomicrobiae bacterium]|nr:DUF4190 domain-containing protein [Verrucomicrobiae bacterium]